MGEIQDKKKLDERYRYLDDMIRYDCKLAKHNHIVNYPSHCCQKCGENIGWIGRVFQWIGMRLHICN